MKRIAKFHKVSEERFCGRLEGYFSGDTGKRDH